MSEQVKQLGNRFGIIQLSDLQFGKNHRFNNNPDDLVIKIPNDIRKMAKEYNFRPLYIVLSGDISETGSIEEFSDATNKLNRLFDELEFNREKILCIPGNHDVSWDLSKVSEKTGDDQLKFKHYNSFVPTITQNQQFQLDNGYPRIVDTQFQKELGLEIEFLLLNSCE